MFNTDNCLILTHFDKLYNRFHSENIHRRYPHCLTFNYSEFFLENGLDKTRQKIRNIVRNNEIGIIFIFINRCWELSPELLNELRETSYLVFWLFDEENHMHPYTIYLSQTADAVINTDYYGGYLYEQIDIPSIHYPSFYSKEEYAATEMSKIYDVSFVGIYNKGNRRELIEFLQKNGIKAVAFGSKAPGGYVSKTEMMDIFRQSKINLNFSELGQFGWYADRYPWQQRVRQRKGRPIEIAMTKNFCLSQYAPDAKEVFTPGAELIEFHDKEDLLTKVRYYLEHEDERMQIAERAYRRALEEYESGKNFPKLFDHLIQILSARNAQRQAHVELFFSSFHYTQLAYFYILYMLIMLKHGKMRNAMELGLKLFTLSPAAILRGIVLFFTPKEKYING